MTSALKLTNVGKCFGAFWALRNVDLEFQPGEIHAVVGENGAGKSTLIKLIAGVYKLDEGAMSVSEGGVVSFTSPRDAMTAGIGVVHQELDLFDNLSVGENIAIGAKASSFWRAKSTVLDVNAAKALSLLNVPHIAASSRVGDLSTSDKQLVAIAKVLTWDARVIILDEPTSALNAAEADRLLARVRNLRDRGVTVIYVSHKLGEIFSIADRVSVIRDGRLVITAAAENLDHDRVVNLMLGRTPDAIFPARASARRIGEIPALRVSNLSGHQLQNVSLDVWSGEIVALAGLPDSGSTSLLQHVFGLRQPKGGEVSVAGTSVRTSTPPAAVRGGLAYLPADRLLDGILPLMSVLRNAGATSEAVCSHSNRERLKLALAELKRLSVRSSSLENKITALSGGNQQKTLLARWLVMDPKVLMLDDPTRGVDIGAKAEIYKILREIADCGSAVLFTSSDSLELANLADRIVFFKSGQVAREVNEISHADLDQYIAAA